MLPNGSPATIVLSRTWPRRTRTALLGFGLAVLLVSGFWVGVAALCAHLVGVPLSFPTLVNVTVVFTTILGMLIAPFFARPEA